MEAAGRLYPSFTRVRPVPLGPLTAEQQQLAAQNHNLIYAFLHEKGYDVGDYYDAAALGLLQAAQRYLTQPRLRRYAFATIAWQAMGREIVQSLRTEIRQKDAEYRYLETIRARPPNLDSDLEARLILHDLLAGASEEQRRLALLRLRGCSVLEAAQAQGMGVKRARRLLKELRGNYLTLNSETERGLKFHEY